MNNIALLSLFVVCIKASSSDSSYSSDPSDQQPRSPTRQPGARSSQPPGPSYPTQFQGYAPPTQLQTTSQQSVAMMGISDPLFQLLNPTGCVPSTTTTTMTSGVPQSTIRSMGLSNTSFDHSSLSLSGDFSSLSIDTGSGLSSKPGRSLSPGQDSRSDSIASSKYSGALPLGSTPTKHTGRSRKTQGGEPKPSRLTQTGMMSIYDEPEQPQQKALPQGGSTTLTSFASGAFEIPKPFIAGDPSKVQSLAPKGPPTRSTLPSYTAGGPSKMQSFSPQGPPTRSTPPSYTAGDPRRCNPLLLKVPQQGLPHLPTLLVIQARLLPFHPQLVCLPQAHRG